jgi:hypothetical protein
MKKVLIIILFSFLLASCGKNKKEEPEPQVKRNLSSFIFVGMAKHHAGLYKYNAGNNSYSVFWESREEKVSELSYSDNHNSAFFLTAIKEGKQGIFPFIKGARLYVIPDSTSKPEFVEEIGSGLQVFSRWESETVFRIVLNSWDKKVSTYINQKTIIFNTFGRILREETKTYDITTDGYPRLSQIKPDSLSPAGRFKVDYSQGKADSLFLFDNKSNNKYYIKTLKKPVKEISWSDSRNYIFISTLDVTASNKSIFTNSPNTSSLYIYSVPEKKIIKEWTGGGYKNFFTVGEFLIFDDGFRRNSSIYIYNYKDDKIIDHIKIKGGCGLRGIPEIPKFGA